MHLSVGQHSYQWLHWAKIPDTESGRASGRTHGVEVSQTGAIVVFHQADPAVLVFDSDGMLHNSWGDRFRGAHGLTLVNEGGTEYLWLTDQHSAEVVKTTLDGRTIMNIQRPDLPVYHEGKYSPTWVAVNSESAGGNGDIWVTDGYGQNYVHRYTRGGDYIGSINGEEGAAGAFRCPHSIWFDTRKTEPELYIADRTNHRIQVYDADGRFKRVFGSDFLTSPCAFTAFEDRLIIPELRARVTVLDGDDRLIGVLGDNESVVSISGWPNHPAELIQAGKFNSPHDAAADNAGNIYVVEWIIGGRITKLARA
jgi:hypothetical protein